MSENKPNNKQQTKGKVKHKPIKKEGLKLEGTKKVVLMSVLVIAVFAALIIIVMAFINRTPAQEFTAGDMMPDSVNPTTQTSSPDPMTTTKDQDNVPDIDSSKSLAQQSGNTQGQQQRKVNSVDDLRSLSKEEREALIKDTTSNHQAESKPGFVTEDQKQLSQKSLGITTDMIATKKYFLNYEKHIAKTADRAFVLWLDGTYIDKKYYITVPASVWSDLPDKGTVPVDIEYYVDKSKKENVISMTVSDDFRTQSGLSTP